MFSRLTIRIAPRFAASAALRSFSSSEKFVGVERHGRVALVTLQREKKLNALCSALVTQLTDTLRELDASDDCGAVVLTGSPRAFAAGADIAEMADMSYVQCATSGLFGDFKQWKSFRTPIVAAVSGFALGGGCELAMMCDIIIASESAKFGQPEIKIGTIAGIGGTQRLARAVGKAKAMEMNLTGEMIDADTAERYGLVARVVPDDQLVESAIATAQQIADKSAPVVALAKHAVNLAFETPLQAGLDVERQLFEATFSLDDRREGMSAFVEKRAPQWKHK